MSGVISWIVGHQALVAGVVVAVLDLVVALVPSLEGNGILHQLLLWAQSISKGSNPPPAAPVA